MSADASPAFPPTSPDSNMPILACQVIFSPDRRAESLSRTPQTIEDSGRKASEGDAEIVQETVFSARVGDYMDEAPNPPVTPGDSDFARRFLLVFV